MTAVVAQAMRILRASAQRMDLSEKKERDRLKKYNQAWQADSYLYTKQIPELGFAHNFTGNMLSRVRFYVGAKVRPDEPPAQLDEELAKELDIPWDLVERANHQLERLDVADGGISQLQYRMGYCGSVAGQWYLYGKNLDTPREDFEILSTSEIKVEQNKVRRLESPNDRDGELIYDDRNPGEWASSYVARVWRPDPEWSQMPYSAMLSVQNECEELLVLGRRVRSALRTAISAGFFLVPDDINLTPAQSPDEAVAAAEGGPQSFEEMYYDVVTTPLFDESAVGAVAPALLQGRAEALREIRLLEMVRQISPELIAERDAVLRRLANGIDLPASVVLGTNVDANHWGMWMVDEDTFKAHIQPLVIVCHAGLWSSWVRPAIEEGVDPAILRKLTLWHDPSLIVSHPNRFQDALSLYNVDEASGEALRKYAGLTEEDRPDKIELRAKLAHLLAQHVRLSDVTQLPELVMILEAMVEQEAIDPGAIGEIAGQIKPPDQPTAPAPPLPGGGAPVAKPGSPAGPETVKPGPPQPAQGQPMPMAASAGQRTWSGAALAAIDRALRQRLQDKADAAMVRAIERAGAKVRRPAMGNTQLAKHIDGVANLDVVARLGPAGLAKAGFAASDLLDETAFEEFGRQFDQLTARAQAQVRQIVESLGPVDDTIVNDQNHYRGLAGAALIGGLVTLGHELLFNPHPTAPPVGEFDSTSLVPPGLVRQATAIAGGDENAQIRPNGAVVGSDGGPVDGVGLGPTATGALEQLGFFKETNTWVHGDPEHPFEPHADLDGTEFSADDDPVLANDGDWPDTDYFYIGDHENCTCSRDPTYTVSDEAAADEETAA